VLACEPDPRTFRKLSAYAQTADGTVQSVQCALSREDGTLSFHSSGSRGSGSDGANRRGSDTEVPARSIDSLCAGFSPDLIKLDVEGAEADALQGAQNTLLRDRPALIVSLYHRTEDLFTLPLWLRDHVRGAYSWHLRRIPCYPAWDLMLYALPL